jgi:hypothetical protein
MVALMGSPVRDGRVVTFRALTGRPPVTSLLAGLVSGWCAIEVGIAAKDGRYGGYAMAAVLVGWAVVAVTVALLGGHGRPARWLGTPVRHAARRLGRPTGWVAWRLMWFSVALLLALGPPLRHPHFYGSGPFVGVSKWLQIIAGLLAGVGLLASLAGGAPRGWAPLAARLLDALRGRRAFTAVAVMAGCAQVATVLAAPDPHIDVFHLLQESSTGLVRGADMYEQVWSTGSPGDLHGGLTDVYPYLPATTLLLAPFRLLLGDVRYGLIAALAVAVAAVRALGPSGDRWPWVMPLLVMIFPSYCYALEQSWTEPLLVACLAVMVWAVASGRGTLAVVAFAVALASKQHVALLVPVAALWPAFGPRRTVAACGLGLGIVAPWLLYDPAAFVRGAIRTNLDYRVLDYSLSVPAWAGHFGLHLGFGATAVALAGAYLLAWRARGDATGFAAGSALVLLTLVEMNKQSFFNHYTLPMGLLVVAMATTLADDETAPGTAVRAPAAQTSARTAQAPAEEPAGA